MTERPIRQIAFAENTLGDCEVMHAVCEDGSLWRAERWSDGIPKWTRIPGPLTYTASLPEWCRVWAYKNAPPTVALLIASSATGMSAPEARAIAMHLCAAADQAEGKV